MSQLDFTALSEAENQHHPRNVKQFGASNIPRSTTKKTALADVKNILAQRTVQSTKKSLISVTKSNTISKKNLFGIFNDKENDICKKETKKDVGISQEMETCSTSHSVYMNNGNSKAVSDSVHPACSFCDKVEDDYADILTKSITLTKSEIDMLALEWERQPVVGRDDMRIIEIPTTAIPIFVTDEMVSISNWPEFDYDLSVQDISLLNDIPAVETNFDFADFDE